MSTEIMLASDFKISDPFRAHRQHQLPPPHFKNEKAEPTDDRFTARLVQKVIVLHQTGAEWWTGHDPHEYLRAKAALLIYHFKIMIKDSDYLPVPLFRVEEMNCKTVGRYNAAVDGYALSGTISFNLKRFPMDDVLLLAHLLKYLACFRQHWMGGTGDYDAQAKNMLKEFGIMIDAKGNVTVDRIKGFAEFLEAEGIPVPDMPVKMPRPAKGKSTNKLWTCHCQGCMVGTKEFFAVCSKCGISFAIGNHIKKKAATKALEATSKSLAVR